MLPFITYKKANYKVLYHLLFIVNRLSHKENKHSSGLHSKQKSSRGLNFLDLAFIQCFSIYTSINFSNFDAQFSVTSLTRLIKIQWGTVIMLNWIFLLFTCYFDINFNAYNLNPVARFRQQWDIVVEKKLSVSESGPGYWIGMGSMCFPLKNLKGPRN